ncbi:MAG: hypothetical protein ACR2N2_04740 [Acidimicrobiia bacterium]
MADTLQNEIAKAVSAGWEVTTQTDTSASLTRKQNFSWGFFVLWFILFFIIGGIIYWIYWMAKKPESMFIEMTPSGEIRVTRG